MKVQSSIALACLVGLASAQDGSLIQTILGPLLNSAVPFVFNIISGPATDVFNLLIGTALGVVDPFLINQPYDLEVGERDLEDCPNNPTKVYAAFTANEAKGLSEFEVENLSMTGFKLNSTGTMGGFDLKLAGGDNIAIDVSGTIGPKEVDCPAATYPPIEFTGVALVSSPAFDFGLEGEIQFSPFQLKSGTVGAFSLTWNTISITFSDLGDIYDDIVNDISELLIESVEGVVNDYINKEFLQATIDSVLPFPA